MPKQKTNSAAKKRFDVKKSGLIKRSKQGKRHILTKKTNMMDYRVYNLIFHSKTWIEFNNLYCKKSN